MDLLLTLALFVIGFVILILLIDMIGLPYPANMIVKLLIAAGALIYIVQHFMPQLLHLHI